jgi:hypothetical protein
MMHAIPNNDPFSGMMGTPPHGQQSQQVQPMGGGMGGSMGMMMGGMGAGGMAQSMMPPPHNLMYSQQMGMGMQQGMGMGMQQGMGMGTQQGIGMGTHQGIGMQQGMQQGMGMGVGMGMGMQQQPMMGATTGSVNRNQIVQQPVEELSDIKPILKPEMGGGLAVGIIFRYSTQAAAYAGASSTYLCVKNTKDHVLRRIKISFPSDIRRTPLDDIAMLSAGQEMRIPMEIVFTGQAGKQIRVDIRSDQGAYVGLLIPEVWELLYPFQMTAPVFEEIRKRFTGICEASKVFTLSSLGLEGFSEGDVESELIYRVKRNINVFVVQGCGVSELLFAGAYRKGMMEEKVLVSVVTDMAKATATLRFNCEDAVLTSTLIEVFKKTLHVPRLQIRS